MGRKYMIKSPFYLRFKKHYCPKCNQILTVKKKVKVVNSCSEEAKYYDFSNVEGFMIGDVKFIWYILYCDKCSHEITIKEMKKIERNL